MKGAEVISCELSEVSAILECLAIYIGAAAETPPDIDCVRGETIRAALYGVSNYIERLQVDLDEYADDREDVIRMLLKRMQDQAEKISTKEQEEAPTKEGTAEREMKSATKGSEALTE